MPSEAQNYDISNEDAEKVSEPSFIITTATERIFELTKRIRIIQGGASAGKTIAILQILIDKAQRDKKPTLTSICSETMPHLKKGAMRDFLSILRAQGYYDENRWSRGAFTYEFENGSIIEFFSLDSPQKVRGPRRDRLFINEANSVPFETFEQLEIRTKGEIYIDYNPVAQFWAHEHLQPRDDADFIILTYKDNEGLDAIGVDAIERRKNRKDWFDVYGRGIVGDGLEGRIYTGWNMIDDIPHEARLERYGLDFGYYPDPTAVVAIYYYNGGYILDEVLYQVELTTRELGNLLKNMNKALIVADSAEPKSIAELKLYGMNVIGAKKGKDSVRNGLNAIRDTKISVTKRSTNLIKEYRNYLYKVDREGRAMAGIPEDGNDHCMDALRYGLMSLVPVQRKREMVEAMTPVYAMQRKKRTNPAR